MKKRSTGPNSYSHFKDREKEIHPDLIRLLIFELMKKRSNRTSTRLFISKLVKKDPPGLNSLSYFRAYEKEIHPDPTRSLISMLVKKRPNRVLIRFLVSKLMKKRSTRTSFLIFVYERHQSHYASAFDSCCYFTLVFS